MAFGAIGSLLSEVTPSARAAYPFIKSLATIGGVSPLTEAQHALLADHGIPNVRLSANRILGILQQGGMGIRRTDLLKIVRAIRDQEPSKEYIQSLKNHVMPDPSRFAAFEGKMSTNYKYTVELKGVDARTGEPTTLYRVVSTNSVLTKNQVYDMLSTAIEENPANYQYQFESMTAREAFYNPNGVVG